ncbi:MAG: hypothetical protein LBS96_00600, partial [Oscillospiraceae bacterium]|nr:hypothetical protein [Oscillospiraceae bacterium]
MFGNFIIALTGRIYRQEELATLNKSGTLIISGCVGVIVLVILLIIGLRWISDNRRQRVVRRFVAHKSLLCFFVLLCALSVAALIWGCATMPQPVH